ncbi:uncharacterized abhydrolase domain-containing protein DDB_G0269086 [Megalops cyprinoides]|uniref:uncharacterized abhydrolase domain-containing protein DDB_G0269086 n=1 Tax=Megalops cyprinoides TaxID=118141 RepID=UPI001864268D|nr:uncharacterized abhydrolase domain-containing protein DDB_G0269086 [Megalops cyprinoides]
MDAKESVMGFTYKMTDEDTANLIKLRASNEALFTGKRNASKLAWRAVIKEMGLQGKLSSGQASKKWENLKKKYKELKYPPGGLGAAGGDVTAASWHWFYLMNEAMEGRLAGSAPALTTSSYGDEEADSPGTLAARAQSRKRRRESEKNEILEFLNNEAGREGSMEVEVKENDEVEMYIAREEAEGERAALEKERVELEKERAELEKERVGLEKERVGLERQRVGLERELAATDRDRAALEREKAGVERDRAAVERDRAQLEKDRAGMERDRATLDRDWAVLEKERAALDRERAMLMRDKEAIKNCTLEVKNSTPVVELDAEALERRERFLSLFEKLIEKL